MQFEGVGPAWDDLPDRQRVELLLQDDVRPDRLHDERVGVGEFFDRREQLLPLQRSHW